MAAALEDLTAVLEAHNIECTGPGEVTCRGCRDRGWMSWPGYRTHVAEAILSAGFIQVVAETNRQYHFNGDEHLEVYMDRPDARTEAGL
jgi:hypothetical protein